MVLDPGSTGGWRRLSLGFLGQLRRTRVRLPRTRPALAGKLWQGNAFALRAREVWLIASNARSGLAPLPPVLAEVANQLPIIAPSSPPGLGNKNPSPPRSMIAGAQNLSESSGEEYDRATPLKVPDRELF
jgi:hypothetical protein